MTQLTFDLCQPAALGRSDFLASDSNAEAVCWIDRWPDWPSAALVLHGPPGCGKTHLAHLWCERASAVILAGERLEEGTLSHVFATGPHRVAVDDAERAPEHALLHLHNVLVEHRGSLLIIARQPPGTWKIELGDLRSRLRAALAVEIRMPDDALLGSLLVKHFADRQLRVAPEVIAYLTGRMERSFMAAAALAARLDALALSAGSPVTVPLARRVLADQPLQPGHESGVM